MDRLLLTESRWQALYTRPDGMDAIHILNVLRIVVRSPTNERFPIMKKTSANSLALAAAFAGLLSGTTVRLNAQPVAGNTTASASSSHAGILLVGQDTKPLPKHSCKGKNDCKGQGGGANAGKNDCKGQGGCATDGSKPPADPPKAA